MLESYLDFYYNVMYNMVSPTFVIKWRQVSGRGDFPVSENCVIVSTCMCLLRLINFTFQKIFV